MASDQAGEAQVAEQHKLVTITVDAGPLHLPKGKYTPEQLMLDAGVAPGRELDRVKEEHGKPVLEPLAPSVPVEIKQGERFISHPAHGGSS